MSMVENALSELVERVARIVRITDQRSELATP